MQNAKFKATKVLVALFISSLMFTTQMFRY